MLPETRKLLADALNSARAIQLFTSGQSADSFVQSHLVRSAVAYQFVIIGEALAQLRQLDLDTLRGIHDHRQIIGFRNQVIHGYGRLNDKIVWGVIETRIPELIEDLERLLG